MVSILGSQSVLVVSQDDKARIPLNLATANKQVPILIRLEYRMELLDYDWVVAEKHKLIPSVYAILNIENGKYKNAKTVTYSGSTFIRICSEKHDTSMAYSYGKDFDTLMIKKQLYNYTKTTDRQFKPIIVLLTDDSPNKNLYDKKTIQVMIDHFIKYDFDTIITVYFTPHQSASNPVERRMAPLSHNLA
ncbi:16074_t:CDS:1, partial [Acaulospora morrowiae]